jgi:uncharacterized membrane protein
MAEQKFTLDEALSSGWKATIENIGGLLLYVFLPGLFLFLLNIGSSFIVKSMNLGDVGTSLLQFGSSVIHMLLQVIFNIAVIKICLKYLDNRQVSPADFIPTMTQFWFYVAAAFLNTLIVGIGLCLLVVPGVILGLMLQFYGFLIVDKGLGPIQAFKASTELTKGTKLELFILWVILAIIMIVGAICLVIGLVPATFMYYMTVAYVYRKCLSKSDISTITAS